MASDQHSTPLRSRTQEITAEYWEVRDEQSERVAVAQLILQFALLEEQLHAVENTPTLNALNEVARLKEQLETTRIELSRTIRLLSNEVDRAEGLEEQLDATQQERDDFATSNRINQDALAWVKSVVYADVVPSDERMAELRHHFERGTFPIQLVRHGSNPAISPEAE